MNIAIRVDASKKIGSGHFFRTFLIAKYLKKKFKIHFISNNLSKEYAKKLKKENFFLHNLNLKSNSITEDAKKTITRINTINKKVELLIVDSYNLDFKWEKNIKKYVKKIFVIDDFKRKHYCDIYLNYNLNRINKNYLPNYCQKLLGSKYIIINPVYLIQKNTNYTYSKPNIFIFMGGADSSNFTYQLIKFFNKEKILNMNFNIVLGINNQNKEKIIKITNNLKNYKIYYNLNNLKNLILKSNLCITNGGQVIWESVYSRKSNIIICKNKYKNEFIKKFKKKTKTHIIETEKKVSIKKLKIIKKILHNKNSYSFNKLSKNNLLDGKGLNRIIKSIRTII